jgi:hypothetical protein
MSSSVKCLIIIKVVVTCNSFSHSYWSLTQVTFSFSYTHLHNYKVLLLIRSCWLREANANQA